MVKNNNIEKLKRYVRLNSFLYLTILIAVILVGILISLVKNFN